MVTVYLHVSIRESWLGMLTPKIWPNRHWNQHNNYPKVTHPLITSKSKKICIGLGNLTNCFKHFLQRLDSMSMHVFNASSLRELKYAIMELFDIFYDLVTEPITCYADLKKRLTSLVRLCIIAILQWLLVKTEKSGLRVNCFRRQQGSALNSYMRAGFHSLYRSSVYDCFSCISYEFILIVFEKNKC